MDLFEAIRKRGSYRENFADEKISRETLTQIVQAGIDAPSGCNAQTTSFVIVDDPAMIQKMAEILGKPYCATAAAIIVCVVDQRNVFGNMSFYKEDCAASTMNILLALTSFGYASVWLDGVLRSGGTAEKVAALLNVPADKTVQIVLPVGRPKRTVSQNTRLPFESRAWFNQFGKNN